MRPTRYPSRARALLLVLVVQVPLSSPSLLLTALRDALIGQFGFGELGMRGRGRVDYEALNVCPLYNENLTEIYRGILKVMKEVPSRD